MFWLGLRCLPGRYTLAGLTLAGAALSAFAMALIYQPGVDPTRVFDWASLAEDSWYISDGTHYISQGYRHRARLSADGLAHAFPPRERVRIGWCSSLGRVARSRRG